MTGEVTLILVGAGGHAKVLLEALSRRGIPVAGITDADPSRHGQRVGNTMVLGDDAVLERFTPGTTRLVNAIGSVRSMAARQSAFEKLSARGYRFATIVHPAAIVAEDAVLGEGAQVMAGAIVQPGARIGANAIVNTGAQVDHDCIIGAHVHLAPAAVLSGDVHIGDSTHVGTGAVVVQGVRIGARCLVAAGAVVTQAVSDDSFVAGVPASPRDGSPRG